MKRPLRRLLKIALLLLALAALFSGLRLWFDARGRAILAKYPARPHTPARPAMPGAGKAGDSVPAQNLPLFASVFSTDPAEKEAAEKFIDEIYALHRLAWSSHRSPSHCFDFLEILRGLHLPVPEGMTQAEAAAAFLKYAEKYAPFLADLRAAASGPGWDFGPPPDTNDPDAFDHFSNCMWRGGRMGGGLLNMLAQAQWTAGDPAAARASWQTLVDLSNQPRKTDPWRDYDGMSNQLLSTAEAGLALGGWRNEDLAPVAREVASVDFIDDMHRLLRVEREAAARRLASYTTDRSALRADFTAWRNVNFSSESYWEKQAQQLALNFVSDTQIAANAALIDRRGQAQEDQFNYQERHYVPPDLEEASALSSTKRSTDPIEKTYFFLADNWTSWPSESYGDELVRNQANVDQTALALALESQKRTTGSYPDSLDALAPAFPGGVPHDIATGQPYFYEKKPDGTFRLWGTGRDQTNHGGDSQKDIVWKLEKPQ